MEIVLLFLKKFWPYIAVALLVVGAYLYVASLQHTISNQQTKIEQKDKKIGEQEASIRDLQSSVNVQNAAIDAWKKKGQEGEKRVQDAQKRITMLQSKQAKELTQIRNQQKPKDCPEAVIYLRNGIDELKWEIPQ